MSEKKYHHHDESIHVEYTLDEQFHHYAVANVLIHPGITPKMANEYAEIFVNALNAPDHSALKAENEKLKSTLVGMCSDADDPEIKQFDKDVIALEEARKTAIDALVSAVKGFTNKLDSYDVEINRGEITYDLFRKEFEDVKTALAAYQAKQKKE